MYNVYYKTSQKTSSECAKLSYPLLMRLLEYAHESPSDVDLHWILERIIQHGADGTTLTMEHYKELVPDSRLVTVEVGPGQKVEVEDINDD